MIGFGVASLLVMHDDLGSRPRLGVTAAPRAVIVGAPSSAWALRARLQREDSGDRFTITAVIEVPEDAGNLPGMRDSLAETEPDLVILADPLDDSDRSRMLRTLLLEWPVDVIGPASQGDSTTLTVLWRRPLPGWRGVVKRGMDLVLGSLLLLVALPPMAVIALMVRFDSRGPALIRQPRYGYANRVIQVLKFRTMHQDQGDLTGAKATIRDDPRVTRLGRLLRATSLDELPQLFNVLRGDMSLVGPRPHPVEMRVCGLYYHDAVPGYRSRHRVRPGITGLAQVSGCRGSVETMEQARRRLEFDLDYINDWSPMLDLRILWRTVLGGFTGDRAF